MKKVIIIIYFILIIFFIILGIYGLSKQTQNIIENNQENNTTNLNNTNLEAATEFTLKDLNENEINLSSMKGKKVFLNFWATWCPPCKMEMPYIQEIKNEYKDIEIISINCGESKEIVQEYMNNNNYNFTALLDTNGEISNKYKAYSIPMSYLIDEDGNIANKHIGTMTKEQLINFMRLDNL